MHSITLSGKGEVTIPKQFRDALHWKPGQQLEVITVAGGAILIRPVHHFKPATLDQVAGCLRSSAPAKALADIEESIEQGVKERSKCG